MARREPRELKVIGSKRITANMLRVTLGGKGMRDFPKDHEGGYVKLNFPQPDSERPITRTYSVRFQRENEIDIDFVLHGDGGPASRWAVDCQDGETIMAGGPGPKTLVDQQADNVTFQISHSVGEHELVYIGAYAAFDKRTLLDNDFSASDNIETDEEREFSQTSHELRIVSPKGETIEYIAGLYYLDREFKTARTIHLFGGVPFFAVSSLGTYDEDSTSMSATGTPLTRMIRSPTSSPAK